MFQAQGIVVLTHFLLFLFLLALPAQNAQSAPIPGQGAAGARRSALAAPEPEGDSTLIPSWYLKRKDSQRIPVVPKGLLTALVKAASETDHKTVQKAIFPKAESNSVVGSDEEQEVIRDTSTLAEREEYSGKSSPGRKAKTAGQWDLSKNYILASITVSAVVLLAVVVGYIIMYQLLNRNTKD